jgi:nitroreductase
MTAPSQIPLPGFVRRSPQVVYQRSRSFAKLIERRRTVRHFSNRPVTRKVIESCLRCAGAAPSGANQQPWHFVAVSDPTTKKHIREAAEIEEKRFYRELATVEWLEALAPLGTDEHKPFLETAPWLIAIFVQKRSRTIQGKTQTHYYANESVGIATGFLITALHYAGLATLTHTPSPMGFLNKVLKRPAEEKPFLLLVTGYPAANAKVPDIRRKPFEEIATFVTG